MGRRDYGSRKGGVQGGFKAIVPEDIECCLRLKGRGVVFVCPDANLRPVRFFGKLVPQRDKRVAVDVDDECLFEALKRPVHGIRQSPVVREVPFVQETALLFG